MALLGRGGRPFRWLTALGWAATWAAGAAMGVGVGAYLTAVGGAGAPGVGAIDVGWDLVRLPALAFAVVGLVHLAAQLVAAALRGRRRDIGSRD